MIVSSGPPPRPNDPAGELLRFGRQGDQRLDLRLMTWPPASQLRRYSTQQWLHAWLAVLFSRQPWPQYDALLLKELTYHVEHAVMSAPVDRVADEDDDGDMYDPLTNLCATYAASATTNSDVKAQAAAAQADVQVSYMPPFAVAAIEDAMQDEPQLYILERPRLLAGAGCTGFRTWEACLHLTSILLTSGYSLSGKTVLELGAGTGLLGLATVLWGRAAHALLTDGDGNAVARLRAVVEQSGVQDRVDVSEYRWGDSWDGIAIGEHLRRGSFDVVVAADVTYEPSAISQLVMTLKELLTARPKTEVFIAATIRNTNTFSQFLQTCDNNNLHCNTNYFKKNCPSIEKQWGLFHSHNTPIKIVSLTLRA